MTLYAKRSLQTFMDLMVLLLAYAAAYVLRFDGAPPDHMLTVLETTLPVVMGIQFLTLMSLGVTRFMWRHVGLREISRIMVAFGFSLVALVALRATLDASARVEPMPPEFMVPYSVICIDTFLAFMGIAGIRIARRFNIERRVTRVRQKTNQFARSQRTLLVGAGQAGALVAEEISQRPDIGITPVGYLDDDRLKQGRVIAGLKVLGPISDCATLARELGVDQVLITIANISSRDLRGILTTCEAARLPTRIIPGIYEILDGKVNLSRIREVSIEDLLGRDPVQLQPAELATFVRGRTVLVTGAGGSIGSEICRQVARLKPGRLVLVERSESSLFFMNRELREQEPQLELVPALCDVCDEQRVNALFRLHKPEIVFHAAAYKHVPMVEYNPGEALKNNVFGTANVANAAHQHRSATFVLVSTDKAVNPTSIMGATKRVAEIFVQALSEQSTTRFMAVRFGNVLGSVGSVLPIFKEQVAQGGPVTITHPEMRRYFMTIPEASELVIQAGAMGRGGEIFALDMGEPVYIEDLARELIRLSGMEPGQDISIVYTGIRPGEKLFEELGFDEERMNRTRHPKIFEGVLSGSDWTEVQRHLNMLKRWTNSTSSEVVRSALRPLVPELMDDNAPAEGHLVLFGERDRAHSRRTRQPITGKGKR